MAVRSDQLLLDPSILRAQADLLWLETDLDARRGIVVSEAFYDSLLDPHESTFLRQSRLAEYDFRIRLRELLEGVQRFSLEGVRLPDSVDSVKRTLLEGGGLDAQIFADEWVYLHSQSWMIARRHVALKAFRDSGAAVVEYGRRLRNELLTALVPGQDIPAVLSIGFLAKVGAKWLVVAGAAAGGGWMGGPVGAIAGLPAVPIVRAFDP